MAKVAPNRIAELRKAKGWTQAQLAEKLNVHWITISKLERGKIQLHTGWMEELAGALGVSPLDIISDKPEAVEVTVFGYVEGGVFQELDGQQTFDLRLPAMSPGYEVGFWVLVEGDHLWPHFHHGDRMLFIDVVEDPQLGYAGRFAIVHTGEGRSVVGYVLSSQGPGKIDLQPINAPVMRGVRVESIAILAEVRFSQPHELASEHEAL